LAVAATPAMTESATRADRMVFMGSLLDLVPAAVRV
jgi:hypothetical protein